MLSQFSMVRNNNALIVYQTLVFTMKEQIHDIELREFYLNNFLETFNEDQNIPVHILIEPLISSIRA
jgi:hypothetical protein